MVALLASATTTLGTIVPRPAAASYYEEGVSFSGEIVRGSIPYWLNVKAIHAMGNTYSLEVSISKLSDPAGSTAIRQRQTWTFELAESEFAQDVDSYHIDVGSDEGPLDVEVIVERRQDAACDDSRPLFVTQPDGGTFRIETGNEIFGTITELPDCGKRWFYSSGPAYRPCPVAGREVQGLGVMGKARRGSAVARMTVSHARQREVAIGHHVGWSVTLRGTIPAERFRLGRLLKGSLTAGGIPWLEGQASFKPKEPLARPDWYDCRGRREARSVERTVAITGNLTVDVVGYESHEIKDPDALARRSWVRPRA